MVTKRIKKIIAAGLVCCGLAATTSCSDWLNLYPEDEIIEDEFWTSAEDVNMMISGAYRYMLENDVLQRFVYLGEMRSDNLQAGSPSR